MPETNLKKLNLGCGEDKKDGYINVDWSPLPKPDVVHDLNVLPYPFTDNSIDLIEAFHVLEHLDKPFAIMKEFHRILKVGGVLHVKVPHFSRGFTHAEHAHGFDVTFPLYFDKHFTKSGYYGVPLELISMKLSWLAFFHLLPFMGYGKFTIKILRGVNAVISLIANISPAFTSRIWCFWVGGFDEIEFIFTKSE
jgi:SAM-dependent methyltransferase